MKVRIFAIAAIAILLPAVAEAKNKHPPIPGDCLMSDNHEDGTEFCLKRSKGMSQAQIDAWYGGEEAHRLINAPSEHWLRITKPNLANCMREINAAKSGGAWSGPPSKEDCAEFAHKLIEKSSDMIDQFMEQK